MPRVTLQTLADRVGVSRSTVSNAFSRPDQLSTGLRERILEAAQQLGYSGPDPVARGLRAGRVGAIGILITGSLEHAVSDPYARELLVGASQGTTDAGSALLLVNLPPDEARASELVANAAVDGFIGIALPEDLPALQVIQDRSLRLVAIDSPKVDGVPYVGVDDRSIGRDLAQLVLRHGHRRIAVLSIRLSPDDQVGWVDADRLRSARYPLSRERLGGVLKALQESGLSPASVPVFETGADYEVDVRRALDQLAGSPSPPTAIIALADRLALTAMSWASGTDTDVPGTLSVVGVDDIPSAAPAGLTTIRQPTRLKAATAVRLLSHPDPPPETLLAHEVVVRASLGRCEGTRADGPA